VGTVLSPVVVQLQDNNGNATTGSTAQVTISSTPAGVSGTLTANAVNAKRAQTEPRRPKSPTGFGSVFRGGSTLDRLDHFFIKVCAAIEDQTFRSGVVRECLAQLFSQPKPEENQSTEKFGLGSPF
jgi:hypothetical protein